MPAKTKTTEGVSIGVEDSVPTRTRGRSYDALTIAVRDELLASNEDQKARSFSNVEPEKREEMGRRVRSAANAIGDDFEVNTIYDPDEKKLYFGPKSVIKKLQDQKKAS